MRMTKLLIVTTTGISIIIAFSVFAMQLDNVYALRPQRPPMNDGGSDTPLPYLPESTCADYFSISCGGPVTPCNKIDCGLLTNTANSTGSIPPSPCGAETLMPCSSSTNQCDPAACTSNDELHSNLGQSSQPAGPSGNSGPSLPPPVDDGGGRGKGGAGPCGQAYEIPRGEPSTQQVLMTTGPGPC